MGRLRGAMVGALVLASVTGAFATDRDTFVGTLKRSGLGDSVATSKKACLCIGGQAGGNTGLVRVWDNGGAYAYDCEVPYFDAQGTNTFTRLCIAWGGSFVLVPK